MECKNSINANNTVMYTLYTLGAKMAVLTGGSYLTRQSFG